MKVKVCLRMGQENRRLQTSYGQWRWSPAHAAPGSARRALKAPGTRTQRSDEGTVRL